MARIKLSNTHAPIIKTISNPPRRLPNTPETPTVTEMYELRVHKGMVLNAGNINRLNRPVERFELYDAKKLDSSPYSVLLIKKNIAGMRARE